LCLVAKMKLAVNFSSKSTAVSKPISKYNIPCTLSHLRTSHGSTNFQLFSNPNFTSVCRSKFCNMLGSAVYLKLYSKKINPTGTLQL
jgi:hypothetical protein